MDRVQSKDAILYDIANDNGDLRAAMVDVIGDATTVEAGLMAALDKAKLDGIAAGATANAADAELRDRTTHTGEQEMTTVTGLSDALAAKATSDEVRVYDSRTAAIAATVPVVVVRLSVRHRDLILNYRRDATGTAITTADGAKWSPADLVVTPQHFGAEADGVVYDQVAFQAAVDFCGAVLDTNSLFPRATRKLWFPGNSIYRFASGSTIRVQRGMAIEGESVATHEIRHEGGGVDCFDCDDTLTSNNYISFRNVNILGVATTRRGIYLHRDFVMGEITGCRVRGCETNVYVRDCWTLKIKDNHFAEPVLYNVDAGILTSAVFMENRMDCTAPNGICNVLVTGGPTVGINGIKFIGGSFQYAQEAGVRLIDVADAEFVVPYFEGNNKASGGHGDIEWLHGPAAHGRNLTVTGINCTSSNGGTDGRIIKAMTAGNLTVIGPKSFIGTAPASYAVGVDLGSSMKTCQIVGNQLDAVTPVVRASENTSLLYTEGGIDALQYNVPRQVTSGSNLYWHWDAPADHRLEQRWFSGGVLKWCMGRGDTDEGYGNDFFINRISGQTTPDFRIRQAGTYAGATDLIPPGPFADDAAAAAASVPLKGLYRLANGETAWRQV